MHGDLGCAAAAAMVAAAAATALRLGGVAVAHAGRDVRASSLGRGRRNCSTRADLALRRTALARLTFLHVLQGCRLPWQGIESVWRGGRNGHIEVLGRPRSATRSQSRRCVCPRAASRECGARSGRGTWERVGHNKRVCRRVFLWRLRHTCAQVWCNRWSACCPCAPGRGRPTPLAASPRRATTQRMQRAVPSPGLPLRPGSHAHQTIPAITVSPTWVPRWGGVLSRPSHSRAQPRSHLLTLARSAARSHISAPLRSAPRITMAMSFPRSFAR